MDRLARERRGRLMAERRLARTRPAADMDTMRPQVAQIASLAARLCNTELPPEQEAMARQLGILAQDMLSDMDIRAGRIALHPAPFDLELAIHQVAAALHPNAHAQSVELIIDYDMQVPTRFEGDEARLRQILSRLIGNAVRFTRNGHVLIRVVNVDRMLHITVEDTGIGIAAHDLSSAMDGGGLATASALVRCMGGEIWAESQPKRGSCFGFRVDLPAIAAARPPNLPATLRRVLVVDDRFISRTIIEKLLKPLGIETRLCRSASEATALLSGAEFDAIIADHDSSLGLRTTVPVISLSSDPNSGGVTKPLLRSALFDALRCLPARQRRMRVLAADDNRTNQLVLRKMVRDLALELEIVSSGEEAVAIAAKFAPDLVFMDLSMQGMTGEEAALLIRKRLPHVPVIALAAARPGTDDQAIDLHMPKPLRKTAILTMLERFRPDDAIPLVEETRPLSGATG